MIAKPKIVSFVLQTSICLSSASKITKVLASLVSRKQTPRRKMKKKRKMKKRMRTRKKRKMCRRFTTDYPESLRKRKPRKFCLLKMNLLMKKIRAEMPQKQGHHLRLRSVWLQKAEV